MTNILDLPQMSGSLAFVNNADWRDPPILFVDGAGNPLDLTGITFKLQIRPAPADPSILLELSTANGGIVSGGLAGTLTFMSLQAANTQIPPGSYVADLLAEGDGAIVNLFAQNPATATVNSGVTLP